MRGVKQSVLFLTAFLQGKIIRIHWISAIYWFYNNLQIIRTYYIKLYQYFTFHYWPFSHWRGVVLRMSEDKVFIFRYRASCGLDIPHKDKHIII